MDPWSGLQYPRKKKQVCYQASIVEKVQSTSFLEKYGNDSSDIYMLSSETLFEMQNKEFITYSNAVVLWKP